MDTTTTTRPRREPWNKGKLVGQKAPFKLKDIWALRVRLQMESRVRELALLNLGIDSKLRGCDLVALKVRDVCHGDQVASRAVVLRHKTQRPVPFEITQAARDAVQAWIREAALKPESYVSFLARPQVGSPGQEQPHMTGSSQAPHRQVHVACPLASGSGDGNHPADRRSRRGESSSSQRAREDAPEGPQAAA